MKRILVALALCLSAFADSPQPFLNGNVTSAVSVKPLPGSLYGYAIGNTNSSFCYLQIFNTANVTLGTTVPVLSIPVPANSSSGGGANLSFPPVFFNSAISIAATTTYNGSTTCSTGMTVNLLYY